MRSRLKNGTYLGDMLGFNFHGTFHPVRTKIECKLESISLYKSPGGIPAMRWDYGNCPVGIAKKASIIVGLKKVADSVPTPELGAFLNDVCYDEGQETVQDAVLDFSVFRDNTPPPAWNETKSKPLCWVNSADVALFTSSHNCFEPGMIITFTDQNNHFPVFPVKAADWDWLISKLPTTPGPAQVSAPVLKDPCAPVAPIDPAYAHVYGSITVDRVCVSFTGLECDNQCGKNCTAMAEQSGQTSSTTTLAPVPAQCYDCEFEDIVYACIATFIVFFLTHYSYKMTTVERAEWYYQAVGGDAMMGAIKAPVAETSYRCDLFWCAIFGIVLLTLLYTVITYLILNLIHAFLIVNLIGSKICVKLYDWQTANDEAALTGGVTWHSGESYADYYIHNDVCPFRLLPLMLATWLSLLALFCYWRYFQVVAVKEVTFVETETLAAQGGGGGGG
jgi:hypothetical protein